MKSMPHMSTSSIWRLFYMGIVPRAVIPQCNWHLRHLRTKFLVSSNMVGQKNPLCQIFSWVRNKVSPIWCYMALLNDPCFFSCWYTPSQQAIRTNSVEVWIIPQVESTFIDQLFLVFSWWYIPWNHKVHNICIPGGEVRYLHQHVIPKEIIYR